MRIIKMISIKKIISFNGLLNKYIIISHKYLLNLDRDKTTSFWEK